MPYDFITSKGSLSPAHIQELRKKRGLTDETIRRNRLFSGGRYLLSCEAELISSFPADLLTSSGVMIPNGKTLRLNPLLLDERIIIPYLNKEGKAVYLRPHKLGLKGVPIGIYHEYNVRGEERKGIIMTEGEFKAMAAQQLGIPAISIPGISSFSKDHYPRLIKFLNANRVKEVVIIFDNEVKNDPKYPDRYKENPAKRYDAEFYAYIMCDMLTKEGFKSGIVKLPDSWRIEGKADIDGAVAQGKTKNDFLVLIQDFKTARQYVDELPKEAQAVIRRKNSRRYFRSNIRKEFGRYVVTKHKGKQEVDEVISNFTVVIVATHETVDLGLIRYVKFVNEYGEETHHFPLTAEDMASADSFTSFCLAKGNYIWRGQKDDLLNLWEGEFLSDDGRHIVEPDCVGWINDEEMWLFGNIAVKGTLDMRPDKNGVFWTERKGFKPIPLGVTTGKSIISEGVPYLSISSPCDIAEIRKRLEDTIGEAETIKCLGWVNSIAYMEQAFEEYNCYPFLFLHGRTGSGKSTIAEWLCCFFGIENSGITLSQTTAVGIQRSLSYYSSLPVFLDEYRNTNDIIFKTHFLRNVYNRQSSGKGIKANFGLRMAKVRGTIVLAGEETPNDAAICNRSIIVNILKSRKKTDHLEWFTKEKRKFSYYFINQIKTKDVDGYMKICREAKDALINKAKVDERTAINYSIVAAGWASAFGNDKAAGKVLASEILNIHEESQKSGMCAAFFEDCQAMRFNGGIKDNFWRVENNTIYLYFQGIYNAWAKDCRSRGVDILKASSLLSQLKEEPGFLRASVNYRIDGFTRSCMEFDYSNAPEGLKNLVCGQGLTD